MKTKAIINSALVLAVCFILLLVAGCNSGDFGKNKHIDGPYTIIEIGDCSGGSSLFDGNRTCAVSVKNSKGLIFYGQTWDKVMPGKEVYRECWTEEDGDHCFLPFKAYPRRQYREGN